MYFLARVLTAIFGVISVILILGLLVAEPTDFYNEESLRYYNSFVDGSISLLWFSLSLTVIALIMSVMLYFAKKEALKKKGQVTILLVA